MFVYLAVWKWTLDLHSNLQVPCWIQHILFFFKFSTDVSEDNLQGVSWSKVPQTLELEKCLKYIAGQPASADRERELTLQVN